MEGCNLYKGTRFNCHQKELYYQREHNQLCYNCAFLPDKITQCPIHLEETVMDYNSYNIEPSTENDVFINRIKRAVSNIMQKLNF